MLPIDLPDYDIGMTGLVLFGIWFTAALILAVAICRSPEGYEDADGFHFGPVPPGALDELDFDAEGNDLREAFQLSKFPGRQLPDGPGFVAPFDPFHAHTNSAEAQRNHGR